MTIEDVIGMLQLLAIAEGKDLEVKLFDEYLRDPPDVSTITVERAEDGAKYILIG